MKLGEDLIFVFFLGGIWVIWSLKRFEALNILGSSPTTPAPPLSRLWVRIGFTWNLLCSDQSHIVRKRKTSGVSWDHLCYYQDGSVGSIVFQIHVPCRPCFMRLRQTTLRDLLSIGNESIFFIPVGPQILVYV
jgi:hypothetical protein